MVDTALLHCLDGWDTSRHPLLTITCHFYHSQPLLMTLDFSSIAAFASVSMHCHEKLVAGPESTEISTVKGLFH